MSADNGDKDNAYKIKPIRSPFGTGEIQVNKRESQADSNVWKYGKKDIQYRKNYVITVNIAKSFFETAEYQQSIGKK